MLVRMSQRKKIVVYDDIDGTEDAESVQFGFQGKSYEIDLSPKNLGKLTIALAPYLAAGRKVSPKLAGEPNRAGHNDRIELAAARTWLRENGHNVSDRGRVPANLLDLYRSRKTK